MGRTGDATGADRPKEGDPGATSSLRSLRDPQNRGRNVNCLGKSAVLGLTLALVVGCGRGTGPGDVPQAVGTPSLKPFPPELRILAEQLDCDMKSSPSDFRDNKSTSQLIADGYATILALQGIQSTEPDIASVATQGAAVMKEFVARFERINAFPKPPSSGEIFADSFLHGLYGNFVTPYAHALEADEQQRALLVEVQALVAAADQADALHLLLPTLTEKYAATPTVGSSRIQVNIDEPWGGIAGYDWLHVFNGGAALEDCTVEVELFGATGEVRKNVHFVRRWPANAWMSARYAPGYEAFGRPVGRETVTRIQTANVRIWSPQFTTSIAYTYRGAEQDADIAKACQQLTVSGRYEPFAKGLLWNTQRGCYFTLKGLPAIGSCQAKLTFQKGLQWRTLTWDLNSWGDGEEKHFGIKEGDLTFDPDTIDLVLAFPDSSYQHKARLKVRR